MTKLSSYFVNVVAKALRAVEADPARSNQHEFNGTNALKEALGNERFEQKTVRFIWLGSEEDAFDCEAFVTWYDARERHPTRSEWRLYFESNPVMELALEGALLLIACMPNGELVFILAEDETVQQQLLWLFDLHAQDIEGFSGHEIGGERDKDLGFAEQWVLDVLGFDSVEDDDLGIILERFGSVFPRTSEFSAFVRELEAPYVWEEESADDALMRYLNREETLFRTLERHLIDERLRSGFVTSEEVDVEAFISFSLSVQNRRKSRAGHALENHLAEIFRTSGIQFSHGAKTEGNKKPDFLFPTAENYHDPEFPVERLTLLGAKSSCKDRWRQVLSEGARVPQKHLVTLQPSISSSQTDEMRTSGLQLVLPRGLHQTYSADQRPWLMAVEEFIALARAREAS
ncbi:type II restriction endonuclease [Marinicauda sp. Alg238-R41]|uniref:type II restriction endonuclease n=1 Tax=Marinicauda sp. Alg238-R41 TaxID=2993447 RepID=UPI0022E50631|nr:type II restriction endonuclease [Marinicauda sp. Alg238-R41]